MKTPVLLSTAGLVCLGLSPALLGQDRVLRPFRSDDDKPVMRAVPVRPPQNFPDDPVATPTPKAKATPIQIRRAQPVNPKSSPTPAPTAKSTPMPAPEPADPGEIRMSPQGVKTPDQAQFDLADGYYARKMYDMAIGEYQRYIDQYPGGADTQGAFFRLAESYRRTGSSNAAKNAYDLLLSRYQSGDYVGPAAFWLGYLYYQEKNYTFALPFFRKATVRLKEPGVVHACKFYTARSLEAQGGGGNKLEAMELYRELADTKESNPFQEASRLSAALLLREAGRIPDAVKQIKLLATSAENPELKAEATVRAGIWELDLQQTAKAAEDLNKALKMPGLGKWKEVAQLGLVRMNYDAGKYKEVLDTYTESGSQFSPEVRPELLLLAANSQRQLGKPAEALELYNQLLKDFPASPYAKDASYQRLVTLYNSDDDKLIPAIDDYLTSTVESDKRDQVLLMKAESLYKKQDYAAAAPIYGAVSKSRALVPALRAESLFKLGWCTMQTREFDKAVAAFTELIDGHPTFKSLTAAIAQRALAFQSQKNLSAAEKDYTLLISKYPKSKERELALQQKALIRGQQNDAAGMIESFTLLLRDYPTSPAAAEASFWIGRSAFDTKDYKRAAEQLAKARELDHEKYFERASLPLILSYYYLGDRAVVSREVDAYAKDGKSQVPAEVIRWLAEQFIDTNTYEEAEKYLAQLSTRPESIPRDLLKLGQVRLKLQKYAESAETLEKYLSTVREPPSRALGLLDLAKARIGGKDFASAQKAVDEALTLQPEGKLSGEARILAGDIQAEQTSWDQAAKLYMSVAVILDDEEVTPRALEKAVNAYEKAGKTAEAKKTLNTLQSRYPEYAQRKKVSAK